jgi:polyvinyl alcohol dehydrogenase (cytochrome)
VSTLALPRPRIGLVSALLLLSLAATLLATAPATAHHAACAPPTGSGGEWPAIGGDLAGTRNQGAEFHIDAVQAARLEPVWTFDANRGSVHEGRFGEHSEITGYPVVVDGCVYVGTSTGIQSPGWIFALNADTGEIVWRTRVSHGVYSSLAVADGRVFAFVSRVGASFAGDTSGPDPWGPYVVALDQHTGRVLWQRTVDTQVGSDAVSSPVVYDGMVWVGVSGTAAEGDEGERLGFQGSYVLLDAVTGRILEKTWTIPEEQWSEGYAGGAIWSTIAIDEATGFGFVGTGNPFNNDDEHEHTNAVLKIDLNRRLASGEPNPDFGAIVGSYKGDVEQYFPIITDSEFMEACEEAEELDVFSAGFECLNLDLDFGAQPNVFTDATGRTLVGAGQKSGVYHVIDPETMTQVRSSLVGVPSAVGGIVGTPAVDEYGIHGPHTIGGYLWSIDREDGAVQWVQPLGDGVHWGNPVTAGNGVVYTVDLKGFLSAYDSGTGLPLLHRPLALGSGTWLEPTLTWGGVSLARNTVFASVGVGLTSAGIDAAMPNGFVIAYRPAGLLD